MERVTFVAGRAGAGKSRYLRERMRELLLNKERVLVIVPEQFTFETERELTEAFSGGLYNVSVFSFTTLARRVLKKSGERSVFLSPEGMRMVVKKSVNECEKKTHRVFQRGGAARIFRNRSFPFYHVQALRNRTKRTYFSG